MEIIREVKLNTLIVRLIRGDLTESDADVIVNAANSYLQHGGGVAGAIVKKGGQIIQDESDRIGFVAPGNCAITKGGSLKARYVIHAVGPRWGECDEEVKLASAVKNSLNLASEKGFTSISMPAISAGIFGFPKKECAAIITGEIIRFAGSRETSLARIDLYLMDNEIIDYFSNELESIENT